MSFAASLYNSIFGSGWHPKGNEVKTLLVHVEYAGTPSGNVTPDHIGQHLFDTANSDFYIATGTANTDWKLLTTE